MLFNKKTKNEVPKQLYTIVEIDHRLENCGACGIETETYYRILNNYNGKKTWINKRFAHTYGL